ncbi:hypothetical protein [Streptomyces microflavus]|uniref:hypothetical protein n=1 Tax=Streptomyces microflavus TaxID=1919 RepID=UPI0036B2076F
MSKYDGFANDAEYHSNSQYKRGCSVGRLLETLNEDDREAVREAMARVELTNAGIAVALKARGVTTVTAGTIGRHRRAACSCGG